MIRFAAAALLLGGLIGCQTIQPVASPGSFVSSKQPELIWVTNEWNEVVPLGRPRIAGDSLVGTWIGLGDEVRIPLATARNVEAKQFNAGRTFILAGSLATVSAALVYWVANGTGDPKPCNNPEPGQGVNEGNCN
jgi:hypothetical protein